MKPLTTIRSRTVVLPFENIDTDRIIPARFLTTTQRTGLGRVLFNDWRYREDGSPNPDFVLNQADAKGAQILVAGRNFGCGSSREHAPWALIDHGFRCVIAPSFADIFFGNCYKNGLLPVVLAEAEVDALFYECASFPGFRLIVDLVQQAVSTSDGSRRYRFDVDPFRKHSLLNGLDEIGLTLKHADKIRAFEDARREQFPWLFR